MIVEFVNKLNMNVSFLRQRRKIVVDKTVKIIEGIIAETGRNIKDRINRCS